MEKDLIKREYVGNWNYVKFENEQGEILQKEITDEEYLNLDSITPEGYKFISAGKGAFKADTETGFLADGEFMIIDGRYYAKINGREGFINTEN